MDEYIEFDKDSKKTVECVEPRSEEDECLSNGQASRCFPLGRSHLEIAASQV